MSYTPTNWTDHIKSSSAFNISENADGTYNITPAGEVVQQGTPISAENLNHMEQGIVEAISENAINRTTLGYQGKNLFKVTISTQTNSGITYTVNSDKSITASGTQSLQTNTTYLTIGTFTAPFDGEYILTGYPITDSSVDTNLGYLQYGATVVRTLEHKLTMIKGETIHLMLCVKAGCTLDNRVFIPMIRLAGITDDTYEPYIQNVNERIANNDSDLAIHKSTLGYTKKNLLKNNATSTTVNGITFTVNSDKSITANGTATENATVYFKSMTLTAGASYILSGCPTGGSTSKYRIFILNTSGWTQVATNEGQECGFVAPASMLDIRLTVYKNCTVENLTFYPMIRHADITDDTYEPYVPDVNTRLFALEDKQALSGQLLAETSFGGGASGSITIDNLASYSAVWAYIDGNVSGINFAVNVIIPLGYLSNNPESSVKLAGGIPSDAYITSSGPQAPKDTSGYIIASVNENVLELELSGSGTIGNVKIVSM